MGRLKILIVDDDPNIIISLSDALNSEYDIFSASNGVKALELVQNGRPDLAIVDCHMPGGDGFFFCCELRKLNGIAYLPTLIISGDIELSSKLKLYDAGADDYIEKPFSFPEIKAKIKAILRGRMAREQGLLSGFVLDLAAQEFHCEGQSRKLSKIEAKILHCLLGSNGALVRRLELYKAVWSGQKVAARTIDVHIANLRKKLPEGLSIESRYGLGYVLKERELIES